MGLFVNPQNLPEAFGIVILLLGLSGLFPFYFEANQNTFKISRILFTLTVLHVLMYAYVNITSLMENWKDFSQPMIGQSSLTAFGNLVLRLQAIIITSFILAPLLVGSRYYVSSLNIYVHIVEQFMQLGVNVKCIYRRVYQLCIFTSITIIVSLLFTAWHSIYFYELITHHPPALKYYLVAFLANFYKVLFMFYGNLQLFAIYLLSKQLNYFLDDLLLQYQQDYESQRIKKDIMRKKDLRKW